MANGAKETDVSILLLGSGWTSSFLVPLLQTNKVSFARTGRSLPNDPLTHTYTFAADATLDEAACRHLPRASLVVIIFPLHADLVERLVVAYERGTGCTPAWLALGSTGAWSKGVCTSDTPIVSTSERAQAEEVLLQLTSRSPSSSSPSNRRQTAVLNLAGLYGAQRNPVNFAKRACATKEKLREKTSLHLVHGTDVARAILGMWTALQDDTLRDQAWGRRWMVTDTHAYDWWQLLSTLQPTPIEEGAAWVKELMTEYSIPSLPRPWPNDSSVEHRTAPHVLERALDGRSFWQSIGLQPSVGRCDDYANDHGGGTEFLAKPISHRGAL